MRDQSPPQAASDTDLTASGFVWVYQYIYWDEAAQTHKTSKRFATADVIKCGLGVVINSSGKRIPTSKLIDGAFAE
jgi:hypothetical protein